MIYDGMDDASSSRWDVVMIYLRVSRPIIFCVFNIEGIEPKKGGQGHG